MMFSLVLAKPARIWPSTLESAPNFLRSELSSWKSPRADEVPIVWLGLKLLSCATKSMRCGVNWPRPSAAAMLAIWSA